MKKALSLVFLCVSFLHPSGYAEELHRHAGIQKNVSAVESLSPGLRDLLKQEMLALQQGMVDIVPAYISGQWGEVESIARKMKNSFILKQSLTERQIKELHASVPADFLKQDEKFHYLAGMLSHVAENKKPELVAFYFSRLGEACVSCHAQYAGHRFPAFAPLAEPQHTEHQHRH